jgi:hypothetical protein
MDSPRFYAPVLEARDEIGEETCRPTEVEIRFSRNAKLFQRGDVQTSNGIEVPTQSIVAFRFAIRNISPAVCER